MSEPPTGALPILSVGPAGMLPPQLGDGQHPYKYLELMETIDPNVSSKLRLAAAAGEPFGCLHVESFGGPGSGYGYLSYALKDATVISVQDANQDGSPFQTAEPSVAAPSTPVPATSGKPTGKETGKGKAPAAAPPAAPPTPTATAKVEKVVLGYSSLTWEYQEAAGGAQAPIHRGAGTIVPPPPPAPLSYSNLVFAFGGLVAAAVFEILVAIGILIPNLQKLAGLALIVMFVCLLPANVYAARAGVTLRGKAVTPLWLRVPVQLVFIGLTWWSTR